ncbi:uncharacterized protein LOC131221348 isoform X2 [Magnolia sinica]|uniref:uncharacterized protein LOC131221348 isoform X2 n=1 Tax=Magnolia sinica TaxID=86752 RepID=UPI00265AEC06|nr:uncharacterized protein LOC131221348 isoform X2 [Magnolia sinica]
MSNLENQSDPLSSGPQLMLTRDDCQKLYLSFGSLYPFGHEEFVVCEDIDQGYHSWESRCEVGKHQGVRECNAPSQGSSCDANKVSQVGLIKSGNASWIVLLKLLRII